MKSIISLIILGFITIACGGSDKDSDTGMTVSNIGLKVGKASLINGQNQVSSSNIVSMGETVAIEVDEVENYTLEEGRAFPIVDVTVTDIEGTVVLEGRDVLAKEDGYLPEDASVLRGTIKVGEPMKSGGTYHARMVVWDRLNDEGKIVVNVDLVVK